MKRLGAFTLALVMIFTTPHIQADAAGLKSRINNLQRQSEEKKSQLDDLRSQLVDLISQIDALEEDIKENDQDIKDAEDDLADAKKAEKQQYNSMKSRIRYFYENDTENNVFNILIGSKGLTDFINKVQYMNAVYSYDRDLLDSYEATRVEIQGMEEDLKDKREELDKEKKSLKDQKKSLKNLIESKKDEVSDIQSQVKAAKALARKRAAERRQRLEEARRQRNIAKAAAAARAAQAALTGNNDNNGGGSSGSSGGSGGSGSSPFIQDADPSPSTDVSGSSVVSYAMQFVGNRYVWGGNSLTNGVDCSGFVVQVYRHFGIDLSGSRNSAALRSVGKAVSPDNIKSGDIVCYPGHVAIYSGDGLIVEAQSSRAGITHNRSWNHGTVLAIRRVI